MFDGLDFLAVHPYEVIATRELGLRNQVGERYNGIMMRAPDLLGNIMSSARMGHTTMVYDADTKWVPVDGKLVDTDVHVPIQSLTTGQSLTVDSYVRSWA